MGAAASGVQAQMQAEHDQSSGFPWWVRFAAKGLGIFGGFVAMFFGVLGVFTTDVGCMIATLMQLVFGFLIIALEAPFCCMFVDFIEKLANFSESRAFWQKAALYGVMGVIPLLMCRSVGMFLGSGMIFACGCLYGFMALGRKGNLHGTSAPDPAWNPQVNQQNPFANNP